MQSSHKLIGLIGEKGSGKSTVAALLSANHGFTEFTFAEPLKKVCATVFNWPPEMMSGSTTASREWREEVDEFWANELGIDDFTPRKSMNIVGTDLFRHNLSDNVWVSSVKQKIKETPGDVVVSDVRYVNEAKMILDHGGVLVNVIGKNVSPWREIIWKHKLPNEVASYMRFNYPDIHESEWQIFTENLPISLTIYNNSTIDKLAESLEILSKLK